MQCPFSLLIRFDLYEQPINIKHQLTITETGKLGHNLGSDTHNADFFLKKNKKQSNSQTYCRQQQITARLWTTICPILQVNIVSECFIDHKVSPTSCWSKVQL